MLFKTKRIEREWPEANRRLRAVMLELDDYAQRELGKQLTIIRLNQTWAENEKRGGPQTSYHLVVPCAAGDCKILDFTRTELETLKEIFDREHAYTKGDRMRIEKCHFHIQMEFSPNKNFEDIVVDVGSVE